MGGRTLSNGNVFLPYNHKRSSIGEYMKEKISVVDAVNQMNARRYQAGMNLLNGVTKSSIENKKKSEKKTERASKVKKFFDGFFGNSTKMSS